MDQRNWDLWQNHSAKFLEMIIRSDKREALIHPDGYGKKTRECGDTMEIFLIVRNNRIQNASFRSDGCLYSVACASAVVHLVEGKSIEEAWRLSSEDILAYLETLPAEERHCADQAIETLQLALMDFRNNERQPWKKFYRRN